jgi:UDP-glucose 4-epimerase
MRILITGGAGFIGSHIVDFHVERGDEVLVVDDLSTGKRENLSPKASFEYVSVTEYDKMETIFRKFKPEVINHHAAQASVSVSVEEPLKDSEVNIKGTLVLLELGKIFNIKGFIYAGSGGTAYGNPKKNPVSEKEDKSLPMSPYGISKKVGEMYGIYYFLQGYFPFVSLRYGNVYGPRQDPFGEAGVIAIFSERMLNNKEVFIFGDGNQTRDFIFIKDVVKANYLALNYILRKKGGIFNIGTGKQTSVKEIFMHLKEITGYEKEPVYKPPRKGEVRYIALDIKKAKRELKFEPETELMEGLKKTVEFFRKI